MSDPIPMRLAIRYEGASVNAYLAPTGTMDGAFLLVTAARKAIEADETLREKFIAFAQAIVTSVTKGGSSFGKRQTPKHGFDRTVSGDDIKLSRSLERIGSELEDLLSEVIGRQVLYTLHVFGTGDTGNASYISNARREDIIKNMKDWLALQEQGSPDVPLHKRQ